jgi:hypothetical protein
MTYRLETAKVKAWFVSTSLSGLKAANPPKGLTPLALIRYTGI